MFGTGFRPRRKRIFAEAPERRVFKLIIYLYAALAGGITNVQVGADLKLSKGLSNPALTAAVVLTSGFVTTMLILMGWYLFKGVELPKRTELAAIPWWAWAGGSLQAVTIFSVFVTAGQAGAALFSALTVTGGAIVSVLLDQYGLVGFEQHSISWYRVAAVVLLIGGTVLMSK